MTRIMYMSFIMRLLHQKKYVDIVMLLGHRIIVEGLEAGDKIITQNIPKLYEGKDVVLQD